MSNMELLHTRLMTLEQVFDSTLTVLLDEGIVTHEQVQAQLLRSHEEDSKGAKV